MSQLTRRTVLRGLGTAMALPFLESLTPVSAFAAPKKPAAPLRMAFLFVPNGMHMQDFTPATEGPGFKLPYILEPLKDVKDSVTVLTGLTQDKARANGDGGGDHARSASAWLTGCQPRKTSGADIKAGISVDQLAAQQLGHRTPFPSLEIGCERGGMAGDCDSGYSCAYSSNISWRSPSTPVAKETDPRLVFERLFGNGDSDAMAESRERRDLYRKSILDFVLEDAKSLKPKLGQRDRAKLEEYFASVREIENRLARAKTSAVEAQIQNIHHPKGLPADYGEHVRLMGDMMILAFQADLTRICTFMFANEGTNRSYSTIGVTDGHHDLSHHENRPEKQAKIREINRFQVAQVAYILEKMASIKEGSGTLLDNSMIVFGAGISDGHWHNHDNLPVLLAGRAGGSLPTARHIRYAKETPMNNLFLSMLDRMGIRAEGLGDSTGRLKPLF
jgi:hypothetical protein